MFAKIYLGDKMVEEVDVEDLEEYFKNENPYGKEWDDLKDYLNKIMPDNLVSDYTTNKYYKEIYVQNQKPRYEIVDNERLEQSYRGMLWDIKEDIKRCIEILGKDEVKEYLKQVI